MGVTARTSIAILFMFIAYAIIAIADSYSLSLTWGLINSWLMALGVLACFSMMLIGISSLGMFCEVLTRIGRVDFRVLKLLGLCVAYLFYLYFSIRLGAHAGAVYKVIPNLQQIELQRIYTGLNNIQDEYKNIGENSLSEFEKQANKKYKNALDELKNDGAGIEFHNRVKELGDFFGHDIPLLATNGRKANDRDYVAKEKDDLENKFNKYLNDAKISINNSGIEINRILEDKNFQDTLITANQYIRDKTFKERNNDDLADFITNANLLYNNVATRFNTYISRARIDTTAQSQMISSKSLLPPVPSSSYIKQYTRFWDSSSKDFNDISIETDRNLIRSSHGDTWVIMLVLEASALILFIFGFYYIKKKN